MSKHFEICLFKRTYRCHCEEKRCMHLHSIYRRTYNPNWTYCAEFKQTEKIDLGIAQWNIGK